MGDTIKLADIPVLDVTTINLGEMAAAERESGQSFDRLLAAGNATRRLLALWLAEYRSGRSDSSEPRRSWSDLSDLRPLGGSSSTSRPVPDSPSPTPKA